MKGEIDARRGNQPVPGRTTTGGPRRLPAGPERQAGASSPEGRLGRPKGQPDNGQPGPHSDRGRRHSGHWRVDLGFGHNRVQLGDQAAWPGRLKADGSQTTQRGSAVLTGVAAIGFLLLLFAGALNLAFDEYAKGALHAAVDEGAQAGAAAGGSLAACQAEAAQVQAGLLHGAFGSGVTITCTVQ